MPNAKQDPLEEPGNRSGHGTSSILPHLQKQVQTQIKQPLKKREDDAEGPESVPFNPDDEK